MKICKKKSPVRTIASSVPAKTAGRIVKRSQKKAACAKHEHPLVLAFSDTVDQTRDEIIVQVDLTLPRVLDDFSTRLHIILQHWLESTHLAETKHQKITQPLGEMLLEWESVDKVRSGKTTLESRMKKLEKIVMTEAASIERDLEQLRLVALEIDHTAMGIIGKDKNLGVNIDLSPVESQHPKLSEARGVHLELAAEESRWCEVIDLINNAAMKSLAESEKELNIRHKTIQESFFKLFRD